MRLSWAMQFGEKLIHKALAATNKTCDEVLLTIFRVAYYIGKNTIPFNKFTPLCNLLVLVKACITKKLYYDEKSCADMVFCISKVVKTKVLDRVKNANFFGIKIDESTDIAVISHLVVFATFVEDGLPVSTFLGLLFISEGPKDVVLIFEKVANSSKEWRLDLAKFIYYKKTKLL
jgi:hypothetical protein